MDAVSRQPHLWKSSRTQLHCHYTIETNEKAARFTLWRTKEDLEALLEEAEKSGIVGYVGLYQELQRLSLPLGGR